MADTKKFYDELALFYHLAYDDWDASMERQGRAIADLIEAELGRLGGQALRILDAACGIGTQTLPLAARGFRLVARDLSPISVSRLAQEAESRQLEVDAAVGDMRSIASSVSGNFDAVLAIDNSLAHLLDDGDLCIAFREFLQVLCPGGLFVCSARDYDKVQRGASAIHAYAPRDYRGERFHLRQEWSWNDAMHYAARFIVDKEVGSGALTRELDIVSHFYAISTDRLLELMRDVGFVNCSRLDGAFYQPILMAKKRATLHR